MRHLPILIAAALFAVGLSYDRWDRWVDDVVLPDLVVQTGAEVLDRNGTLLRAYTVADGIWRLNTPLDRVDPEYLELLQAYEDKRFYHHNGVDGRAMVRAAWQAMTTGGIVSGGSTLTMQVARLIEDGSTGRWIGKLRQMRVAWALERQLSKDEILSLYVVHAPFGGNIEGVRAAALAWLQKEPHRLTAAEAALLVALPQSPNTRRPDRAPDVARSARNRVLARGSAAGVLDPSTAQSAMAADLPLTRAPFPAHAPHLADRVLADADGGHVRTLIDAGLQSRLETLASDTARRAGDTLSVAILVADHRTGDVLATVGSSGFHARDARQGFVDMTRAVRSPGSTLKPLVYGLAFDQGRAHPETLIEDRPTAFGTYAPQNFDGAFRGTLRVRDALQLSLNIPVVTITEAIGPARLTAAMRQSGMRPVLPGGKPGLAIALGGVGVTLEDLVQMYGMIARHGETMPLRITDETGTAPRRVLSPEAAWQVGHILAGIAPPPNAARRPLAYKTGTSYGHRDAWAVGFDGAHVIGVWIGRPDGTPVPGAFGASVAAPLLYDAFGRILADPTPLSAPPASTLILSNAELPQPLQRFRARSQSHTKPAGAPTVAFPPVGAELVTRDMVVVKVRDGVPPFTWMANGLPVLVGERRRQSVLPAPGPGFLSLSVIDATGASARTEVFLR
jgi:penicillin-binding protein 1C